jgi:hypothetical protein
MNKPSFCCLALVLGMDDTIRFGQFLPRLQFSVADQQMFLSWPLVASNFVLETATTPDAAAAWQVLTNDVTTSADQFVLTNPPPASTAFLSVARELAQALERGHS